MTGGLGAIRSRDPNVRPPAGGLRKPKERARRFLRRVWWPVALVMVSALHGSSTKIEMNWRAVTDTRRQFSRMVAGGMSEDGETLVFVSNADLAGQNAHGKPEVFAWLGSEEKIVQVSRTSRGGNRDAIVSGDGNTVFWINGGIDRERLLQASLETLEVRQIPTSLWMDGMTLLRSDTRGDRVLTLVDDSKSKRVSFWLIDPEGTRIWSADGPGWADIDGGGRVVSWTRSPGSSHTLRATDPATGEETPLLAETLSRQPETRLSRLAVSRDGKHLLFLSNLTLDSEPRRKHELFWYGLESEELIQVTHDPKRVVSAPQISGDGKSAIFYAGDGLLGWTGPRGWFRPRGNSIYWFSSARRETSKVGADGCDSLPGLNLSVDGRVLAFSTSCGEKGPNEEIYRVQVAEVPRR